MGHGSQIALRPDFGHDRREGLYKVKMFWLVTSSNRETYASSFLQQKQPNTFVSLCAVTSTIFTPGHRADAAQASVLQRWKTLFTTDLQSDDVPLNPEHPCILYSDSHVAWLEVRAWISLISHLWKILILYTSHSHLEWSEIFHWGRSFRNGSRFHNTKQRRAQKSRLTSVWLSDAKYNIHETLFVIPWSTFVSSDFHLRALTLFSCRRLMRICLMENVTTTSKNVSKCHVEKYWETYFGLRSPSKFMANSNFSF